MLTGNLLDSDMVRVLIDASALLAFWSGAICLGRGALWIFVYYQ
jgi:hypothetical protein